MRILSPFKLLSFILIIGFLASSCKQEKPISSSDNSDIDQKKSQRVVFLGDSLTAGYNLDPDVAYPNLIQKKIDEEGWAFTAVNAGVSGDTTSGGLNRLEWILKDGAAVLVVALGANDGLRGIEIKEMKGNLQKIIDKAKELQPNIDIIIAGMRIPPNLGFGFTRRFKQAFSDLADDNDVPLIPFLLEDVAGIPKLNLPDGIHPTAEGHTIMAETVWDVLRPRLKKIRKN